MSQKPKHDAGAKETVLLRQAVPKYNFTARKLPKESSKPASIGSDVPVASSELKGAAYKQTTTSNTPPVTSFSMKADSKKSKPVAVVGASLQSLLTTDVAQDKIDKSQPQATQTVPDLNSLPYNFSTQTLSSSSRKHDFSKNDSLKFATEDADPSAGASHCTPSLNVPLSQPTTTGKQPSTSTIPAITQISHTAHSSLVQKDFLDIISDEHFSLDQHCKKLENERDILKKDLEVQLQVNSELKRLLVASVGDDLSQRVERLCRDRAQLTLDLGGYSKKMSEEYENLDKVSIQADMWRSKYLASRVMNEELGNARAFYALHCHDSQDALQQMLNERHELRTNLLEVHRVLQQVKSAFDPLNSQRSSSLRSTNVLDLSRSCQQLAEAMRFRLLPAHVAVTIDVEPDDSLWSDSVTRAEQFAHEVLSRPSEPSGSLQSGSSRLLPLTAPPETQITRFHPDTRHENLTYSCCAHCKGEINVI